MAGNQYITNRKALFDENDDDVDDETFLKNSRPRPTNPYLGFDDPNGEAISSITAAEQQMQAMQLKREEIERRTLMSTHRSLGLLEDTEQVGMATAEELARQREQLEQTSERLDNINATLRFSQKHLNGLKSMFGGLKNYLGSGGKEYTPKMSSSPSGSKMSDSSSQPTTITQSRTGTTTAGAASDPFENHPVNRLRQDTSDQRQPAAGSSQQFQQRLDENLEGMVGSLSRLKNLALDLNTEIDSQNDLLDQISNKVEDADLTVAKQNNQMHKLLGKK